MSEWTIDEPCAEERKAADRLKGLFVDAASNPEFGPTLTMLHLSAALKLIGEVREEHVRQRATIIMRNETIQQWRERARGVLVKHRFATAAEVGSPYSIGDGRELRAVQLLAEIARSEAADAEP